MHDRLAPHPQTLVSHDHGDRQKLSVKASLVGRSLVQAIEKLDPSRRVILARQIGFEGPAADATMIAGCLSWPVAQVDRLIGEALGELGWELPSLASSAEAAA